MLWPKPSLGVVKLYIQYRMALTYRKPHLKSRVLGACELLACTCSVAFKGSLDYRSPAHPGAVPVKTSSHQIIGGSLSS